MKQSFIIFFFAIGICFGQQQQAKVEPGQQKQIRVELSDNLAFRTAWLFSVKEFAFSQAEESWEDHLPSLGLEVDPFANSRSQWKAIGEQKEREFTACLQRLSADRGSYRKSEMDLYLDLLRVHTSFWWRGGKNYIEYGDCSQYAGNNCLNYGNRVISSALMSPLAGQGLIDRVKFYYDFYLTSHAIYSIPNAENFRKQLTYGTICN